MKCVCSYYLKLSYFFIILLFRPHSATPAHSPGTSKTVLSPDHMVMADLNGQISHLQSLLETERKRKEACQKEIARLSRGLDNQRKRHVSGGSKKIKSLGTEMEDTYMGFR